MLLNLIKRQIPDIDKICLYLKYPSVSKYQLLINGTEVSKNPKAFIDYSQTIDDVYENLEDYNLTKKRRVLIVFDKITVDMEYNRKLSSIVNELFLKGRKLNISPIFIPQSFFFFSMILYIHDMND